MNNLDAEKALIGSVLINPSIIYDVLPIVQTKDFSDRTLGKIFGSISKIADKSGRIDFVTVSEGLEPEIIGTMAECSAFVPTAANFEEYARSIKKFSELRELKDKLERHLLSLTPHSDPAAIRTSLMALCKEEHVQDDFMTLKDAGDLVFQAVAEAQDSDSPLGMTTGIKSLDSALQRNIFAPDFYIIAARPSMGKTAVGLQIARNMATAGEKVGFFSLEMSKEQLAARSIASLMGIDNWKIPGQLSAGQVDAMGITLDILPKNIIIYDGCPTFDRLRYQAHRMKQKFDIGVLFIDYLQLIPVKGNNRVADFTDIANGMKFLAKELNIPVISMAQLSRKVDERTDHTPQMSDLRESGGIEQAADTIMMLLRPAYYDEDEDQTELQIHIKKNRNGASNLVARCKIDLSTQRIT